MATLLPIPPAWPVDDARTAWISSWLTPSFVSVTPENTLR